MTLSKIKYILPLFVAVFSAGSYGYADSIELDEHMSLHIEISNYFHKGTYNIWYPGADAWIENGNYHATKKMPACLIVLGAASLNDKKLEKFINGLDVTTM